MLKEENNENLINRKWKVPEGKIYKDINDVIKELENMKVFLFECSRNNPNKTILLSELAALNNAILIISENHNGHTIEEIRKKLEEEEQLEKLKNEIFKGI